MTIATVHVLENLTLLLSVRYYLGFSANSRSLQGIRNHEAYVPAEPAPAPAHSRLSRADEHQERATGPEAASRQGAQAPDGFLVVSHRTGRPGTAAMQSSGNPSHRFGRERRLRRRSEFQRVFDTGRRVHGRFLAVFAAPNANGISRLGIVASRKLGDAVRRNRAKRLIREIFRRADHPSGKPGLDIVVIPRRELFDATYASLENDFAAVLRRCAAQSPGRDADKR